MIDYLWTMAMLSPRAGRAGALRKQALTGKWVDHSARDKTLTLQTPRGRLKVAYDRALVCGVPLEQLWTREHIGLGLSTFGRAVSVRRSVDGQGDVVVELNLIGPN
jgi:hypothetical protein